MEKRVRGATDADVVEATAGLVRFMRDLVRTTRRRVRDSDGYPGRVWLADLPAGVEVPMVRDDGVLLRVPYEPRQPVPRPSPALAEWLDRAALADPNAEPVLAGPDPADPAPDTDVARDYEAWLPTWSRWAAAERTAAPRRELYRRLTAFARELAQHDDTVETVLGVGLLTWRSPRGGVVRRHLVTRRISVTVDRTTARITVALDPDAPARLEDREFLDPADGFVEQRVTPLREGIAVGPQHPLDPAMAEILTLWRERGLDDQPVHWRDGWAYPPRPEAPAPTTNTPTPATEAWLTTSPALILRNRERNALLEHYERMAAELSGPDATAPLGLAQLVCALEPAERLAWAGDPQDPGVADEVSPLGEDPLFPLPTNPAQRDVLRRLGQDTAVVVQGPPGTGKTHTIANLTAALLASGQRVLITSQKDQALKVLREKIPPRLRDMCVLLADVRHGGSSELDRSIRALSDRVGSTSPERLAAEIESLRARREGLRGEMARREELIRQVREAETYEHPEVAPGFAGTLADIAERVNELRDGFAWLPPLADDAPAAPPLDASELVELRALLVATEDSPLDDLWLPDPELLPAPEAFAALASSATATATARETSGTPAERLGALGGDVLDEVRRHVWAAAEALHRLGVPDRAAAFDPGDWRAAALADRLARRNAPLWSDALATADEARMALAALSQPGLPHVEAPELDMARTAAMVYGGDRLIAYLAGGGRLRHRFASAEQRQAQELLDTCRVSGRTPETAQDVTAVVTTLRARYSAMRLAERWAQVGVAPAGGSAHQRLARVLDDAAALGHVMEFGAGRDRLDALLLAHGVRVPLTSPAEWDALTDAVDAAAALVAADRAAAEIDALAARVFGEAAARPAPEADAVRRALRHRDADGYEAALADLHVAVAERASARRRDELRDRLAAAHPVFARRLAESAADPAWERRLVELPSAWAWAVAARFCEQRHDPGRGRRLERELATVEADLRQVTEALAAASGWRHCLARMTQEQRQALQAYRSAIAQAGKGTGRYAARHLASARDAMRVARLAVPAWVMPLAQVAETIPPEPNCFDVVIVDEASQASVDAAFLLYLAPRVIVVGDDRQCAPGTMWLGELQPIYDKLDGYLPNLPPWLRNGFRPQSNLYELLSERFPDVVRLSEHFRCMPEIIGWSSEQFYDGRLTPLRQFGADRLDPLRVVAVEGAYTEGEQQKLRNEVEAKHLVETLRGLLDDPAYADRTFGVISLQSPAQRLLLERLIDESIDRTLIERHAIRVGLAPDFQGDERDVIMLSMVVAGTPRAYTARDDQRRFNVAASRARDQLWLFTSVTVNDLRATDLRYSLLTYLRTSHAAAALPPMPRLADVDPDERHPAFGSLFEQRVFRRIAERGFHVVPQYPVDERRIDLVVIGDEARLAVECDGRYWHGTAEQRHADLARERDLKRVGWRFWRVTDSEFTLDPERALAPLWAEFERQGIRPRTSAEDEAPAEPRAEAWHPIELPDEDEADELDEADG